MWRIFQVRVTVDFPALDRLVDYLQSSRQKEIDQAAAALKAANDRNEAAINRSNS